MRTVAISGGFDPLHIGHIRLIHAARALGDRLVVIVNNDNWLKKKKGFAFMGEHERVAILQALRDVDEVVLTGHGENPDDMSVCAELERIKPAVFANGGDRDKKDAQKTSSSLNPEQQLCQRLGVEMVFNVGGEKAQSSSELVKRARQQTAK